MSDDIGRLNSALKNSFRVERVLGEGGMATVYLADDLRHHRRVALKVMKPELSAVLGAERFLAEVKTTARLQHPHVLPLFESGEVDGLLYFVMPFVEGESLRERIDREGRLPVEESVRMTALVASALQYAHERGVIHRDVKPANIMISNGLPIVADFGIALAAEQAGEGRLTRSGVALGTPRYLSPEQATGDSPVDARSDIYSLACVLYEMLTGETPHAARTTQAIVAKRLTVPPVPVRTLRETVPEHVEAALMKVLRVSPADRYQTAQEFSQALLEAPVPEPSSGARVARPATAAPVAPAATPFVGRSKERAELLERLDALADGQGSLTLLGGEPGVGKTRLAEFVLEEARRRGFMCLVGHAYELEGTPPFMPFIEILEYTSRVVSPEVFRSVLGDAAPEIARIMPALRSQFPDIGPGIELPADQGRHYLFHRYREFAERAGQIAPMVVLFDDLHWADEASLLLLEHLVQHLHGISMMVLGTYRDVELDVGRPFAESLERLLRRHSVHRASLRRLPEEDVGALLEALGGSPAPHALVATIYKETEGNPFFVQEVFRHLDEEGRLFEDDGAWRFDLATGELDVPESVRLVIGRRLERVSEECHTVLTTASVVGPRFALAVLLGVGDLDEDPLLDALEEAEAARLIQAGGKGREPTYQFTQELIRQTLIDRLSIPRRQRRHIKIAAALESAYKGRIDEHASEMAYHLYQAGAAADPDQTLRFLRLAGDQALARSGYEDAFAQYERALSLEEDVPAGLVPVLLEGQANALDGMGRWADVIETGMRVLDSYERTGDTDGLARVARLVCYRLDWLTRYGEAAEVGRRALRSLSDAPGPYRARLKCQVGVALDLANEPGSRDLIEEGLAEAERVGDDGALLQGLLSMKIWDYHQGHFARAVEIDPEVQRLLQRSLDQTTRVDLLWLRSLLLPLLGRLDEAEAAIDEAKEVGQERNEISLVLNAAFGELAVAAMRTGDGALVESLGRALAKTFREAGGWSKAGLFFAGLGRLWQGDAKAAIDLMDVDDAGIREPRIWNALSGGWGFRTAAYAGMAHAGPSFEDVEPRIYRVDRRAYPGDGFGLHSSIEGLVVLGELETAAGLYEDAAESLKRGIVGHMDGLWACTTGLAAAAGERWEEAEQHFGAALRQASEIPHVMARFDTLRWWGWMLLRRGETGDRERARELLEESIDGYRKLGASLFEEIASDELARAGTS